MPLVTSLPPIAVQSALLSGDHPLEKFQRAHDLGLQGVELSTDDMLPEQLEAIATASSQTGIKVSAIHIGHTRLIHPDYGVREQALIAIRQAMTVAVDLGAQGVVFKPFYAPGAVLPDLHPYKSSLELEAELLVTQLRATLCDLAYALGTELLMLPVNHQETHLIRRVQHGAVVRQKLDYHPHLKVAASLYHMAMEGENTADTLRAYHQDIGYIYLPASTEALQTEDIAVIGEIVVQSGYSGWLTFERIPASPTPDTITLTAVIEQVRTGLSF